jgi:peptidyl-dipeptidase Dcp
MVNDPEEVIRLFRILLHAAKQVFQTELTQLLALSRSDGVSDFMQWDYRYYSEKLRRSDASLVSSEELPTFRLPAVVNGLVWLSEELYGITMSSASDAPRYHADAVPYSLHRNGSLLGLMYVDVWTRAGKAAGNWTIQMIGPSSVSGSRPVVSLNCNFGRLFPDDPERLNLDHVKLIMHEFGHCLHCLLSDVKYTSMSGMSTPDDHVELPSILHEKFLHDPKFLSRITASPLPFGICNRLLASENKSVGYTLLRNISSSILDLRLHMLSSKELETLDIEHFEEELYEELQMPPEVPFIYVSSAFDHSFRFDYRYYM